MSETFTTNFNALTNNNQVKQSEVQENLDADDMIFYHALRADLDLLIKKPNLQTIHRILDFSRSFR